MLLLSCIRLDRLRRWRRWVLAAAGTAAALAVAGCGSSDPDADLLVPPSSAEALAPAAATSSSVPASTEALDLADDSSAAVTPPTTDPVGSTPTTAALALSTSAVAAPIILEPDAAEESLPDSAPVPAAEPEPEPVSLPEAGAVPEPLEAVVTASPHDHEHPELEPAPEPQSDPAPEPEAASSLPPPVGELVLLAENTEETFIDGSGWLEARYQPIEIEVGTQIRAPDWEATSIVTRPPVDLAHNNLWDIYRCSIHEAYGAVNGWEFVTYAYRDDDGRFRLVVGSARPVGPC